MTENQYFPELFKPFKIGNVEIKNRIAYAALGGHKIDEEAYFTERAKGGTGLLVTGVSTVQDQYDTTIIENEFKEPGHFLIKHENLTRGVHAHGAKIFKQLTAGLGRSTPPQFAIGGGISSSRNPNVWEPSSIMNEMTIEQIHFYEEAFVHAALLCQMAGYDGVEIHAVHEGYLLDQFAISYFNRRNDEYGGSMENRLRFTTNILHGIKAACGQDFPVSLRYSVKSYIKGFNQAGLPGEEFIEAGRDLEEGIEMAKYLEAQDFDMLNCDNGTYDSWYWPHPPMYMPDGLNVEDVAKVKEAVNIPVLVAGKLEKPTLAEKVLKEGKADAITIGRAILADPEYVNKIKTNRWNEVKPCIGCHIGCLGRIFHGFNLSCTVNPAAANERVHKLVLTTNPKNVMVIGGGLGGMEAALVAQKRGHNVSLYEASDNLGGSFIPASKFDFKAMDRKLIHWYKEEIKKAGVDIHLNTRVDEALVDEVKPDIIITGTGAIENTLPFGKEFIIPAKDFLNGDQETGEKVVIIGGGLTGSEIAYSLAKEGKDVTIVEALQETIPDRGMPAANRNALKDLMKYHGVKEVVSTSVADVTKSSVTLRHIGEITEEIPADTVISAIGYHADDELYKALSAKYPHVYNIGDSRYPSNLLTAIWDGERIAREI